MKVYRLRLGRWVVASLEVESDPAEVLAQAIAELAGEGYAGYGEHAEEHIIFPADGEQ